MRRSISPDPGGELTGQSTGDAHVGGWTLRLQALSARPPRTRSTARSLRPTTASRCDTLFGVDVSGGVTAAPDDEVRAFITIDNIVDGQIVENPVTLTVSGNVFEGNVNWTPRRRRRHEVDRASSPRPWASGRRPIELGDLDPGSYTLIRRLEFSAEDGSPTNRTQDLHRRVRVSCSARPMRRRPAGGAAKDAAAATTADELRRTVGPEPAPAWAPAALECRELLVGDAALGPDHHDDLADVGTGGG